MTSPNPKVTRKVPLPHYPALDGLRGCAIFAVLLFHSGQPLFRGGFLGVDVFFVLSGFLITSILLSEWDLRGAVALRDFYMRRVLRLAPALVVLVLLTVLLRHHLSKGFGMPTLSAAAMVLLYLSNWVRAFSGNIFILGWLGHTWSLAIEEQFYLLWPPILVILLKKRVRSERMILAVSLAAISSLSLRIFFLWRGIAEQRIYNGLDTRAEELLAGCILALAVRRPPGRLTTMLGRWRTEITLLCCLNLLLSVFFAIDNRFYYGVWMTVVEICSVGLIAGIVTGEPIKLLSAFLENPFLKWIGLISYSIYLFHLLPFALGISIPPQFFFLKLDAAISVFRYGKSLQVDASLLVRLLSAILLGAASFYLVERPFLRLKRRFTPKGGLAHQSIKAR